MKALEIWQKASKDDREYVLCELRLAYESIDERGEDMFGYTAEQNRAAIRACKAAIAILRQASKKGKKR